MHLRTDKFSIEAILVTALCLGFPLVILTTGHYNDSKKCLESVTEYHIIKQFDIGMQKTKCNSKRLV